MTYYNNKKEFFNGDIILFQRDLAIAAPNSRSHRPPTWYMKLRLGSSGKSIERSTRLTNEYEAYSFAQGEFHRLRNAATLGHSLNDLSFEKHWDDWYKRNLDCGTWKDARQRWHKNLSTRYFKAYFSNPDGSSMRLNEITAQVAHDYWNWRIAYWSTQQGLKITQHNPKRRGAKTASSYNSAKRPSKKTLQMEQTALNQIFADARERGRLQQIFKMKAPTDKRPPNRRPHFEPAEHRSMVGYLRSYRDCSGHFKSDTLNTWHKLQRAQFYHFVIFLLNSGLRVGEAREMRWRDVTFDQLNDETNDKIAVVSVRRNTKTGQNRDVQTQPTANKTLKEWRQKSPYTSANDFVWFGQTKSQNGGPQPFTDLNKTFQSFLKRVPVTGSPHGLLYDRENAKRSLYSLRHTYATLRRQHGVSWENLAANMGCKRTQLEAHYDHTTTTQVRSEIVRIKPRQKSPEPFDAFAVEALRRFKAGEISETALIELIRPAQTSIAVNS